MPTTFENQIATLIFAFEGDQVSIIAFGLLFYAFEIERDKFIVTFLWSGRVERKDFKICKKDKKN